LAEISVIVPARDAEATIGRTLECLAAQEGVGDHEVLVVDDGSSDRTREIVREAPGVVKLLTQEAEGPAAARNRGVAAAAGSALAFLDADCFPEPDWLAAGVRALERADVVQGHVRPDPDADLGPFDRSLWITYEVGLYETASLFVRRETFDRTGGFEEWLKPEIGKAVAEDVWFGWKARRLGARTTFAGDALAHHAVFQRGGRDYVQERRRLRYFPAMAAKAPELRDHFLYGRVFLNRRTAAFDVALAAAAAAAVRRSPWPLLAALPYAGIVAKRGRPYGPKVAAVDVCADLVGFASLLRGSLRYRSLVL
jgi:glycosyltransferase involved in cell wall biosynthesis